MPGYSDTRQLIIDTLMGRPAGTEIQPEDHQAFALALTDYIRSVELVAGTAAPIAFAEPDTVPIQPDNGQCFYVSTVPSSATVTYDNFIDSDGSPVTVSTGHDEMAFITFIWNSSYWDAQVTYVDIAPSYVPITWEELQEKRDHDDLIPGARYRITDYLTTTVAENTQSAGHQFDIIVTALDSRTLSEEASAVLHDYDYFDGSTRLDAWKLWYCLDNNTERFRWADPDGKGVIYRMIDEWGNDCPYDFKNILFKRDFYSDDRSLAPDGEGDYSLYLYTFSFITSDEEILDASVFGNNGTLLNDEGQINGVIGNKIGRFTDYFGLTDDPATPTQDLNYIVFYARWEDDGGFYYGCKNNTFEANCRRNTLGWHCNYNRFGYNCCNNIIGHLCYDNTFEANCYNNKLNDNSIQNSFSQNCNYNILTGCDSNTFKKFCAYNELEGCFNNTFDNGCSDNSLFSCDNIDFGRGCNNNNLSSVSRSRFGENCYDIVVSESSDNTFSASNWGVQFSEISFIEVEYDPYEDGAIVRIKNSVNFLPVGAFSGTENNIIKIYLPETVSDIGDRAFEGCVYLTTIDMGSTVNIGEGVFDGCDALQYLYTRMTEENEFGDHYIESLSPLEGTEVVTFVPKGCEKKNDIDSSLRTKFVGYDFPSDKPTKRVESPCQIWYTTWSNTPLEFNYADSDPYYHHFQDGVGIIGLPPEYCEIPLRLFEGESMLREVYIPKGVQEIPYRCFYRCYNLEAVYGLEDSNVTTIGDEAFRDCTALRSLSFPRIIQYVGQGAFYNCSSLEQLKGVLESDNLHELGMECISHTRLKNITFPSNIRVTEEQYYDNLKSVEFKGGGIKVGFIDTDNTPIEKIKFEDVSTITSFNINASQISEIFIEKGSSSDGGNLTINAQISKIYCKCVDVPLKFAFNNQNDCKVYVPSGSVSAYQAALSNKGNISVIGVKFVSPEGILIE